jgi:hypothetical protein
MVYITYLWRFGGWFIIVLPTLYTDKSGKSPILEQVTIPRPDEATPNRRKPKDHPHETWT